MRIKVNVTAEDIAKGRRGSTGQCPVALAIRRTIGKKRMVVEVWDGVDTGTCAQNVEMVVAPRGLGSFIYCFDRKLKVTPFSFNLNVSMAMFAKLIGTPVPADWSAAVVTKGAKVEVRK